MGKKKRSRPPPDLSEGYWSAAAFDFRNARLDIFVTYAAILCLLKLQACCCFAANRRGAQQLISHRLVARLRLPSSIVLRPDFGLVVQNDVQQGTMDFQFP